MSKRTALIAFAYFFVWVAFVAALMALGWWFASRIAVT
jgi:hypothetical protein